MNIKEKLNKVEKALFIKLGRNGEFVEECLQKNILKIGFNNIDHNLCLQGKWLKIKDFFANEPHHQNHKIGVATTFVNQVKYFYEENNSVLWITFHNRKLYL